MKHADMIIERVLTLDGLPNLQDLGKLRIGETVAEILDCDMASECANQAALKDAIVICEEKRDFVSRALFSQILDDTEEHIDWIETQQSMIRLAGLENYVQENLFEGNA